MGNTTMATRVGFIGLGAMGYGMTENLVGAGFKVRGFDVNASRCEAIRSVGAQAVASVAEAAEGAELLAICVFSADQAGRILADEQLLTGLAPEATIMMHTTMAPAAGKALAKALRVRGFDYLEAPVTGGEKGANDGTLTAIAAGSDAAFAASDTALEAMCSKVVRIGDQVGAAATVKMINQLLVGVHVVATSEALALAARAGADPAKAYEVISNGGGNSSVFEKRAPNMLAGNPEAKGTVDIFLKDLGIVLEAGRQHQLPLPLTASAYQQFMSAAALGGNEDPNPSVLKVYEALGGMNVADITKNAK